jgi:hypothetical protein
LILAPLNLTGDEKSMYPKSKENPARGDEQSQGE